jgi:hypothetical protein
MQQSGSGLKLTDFIALFIKQMLLSLKQKRLLSKQTRC